MGEYVNINIDGVRKIGNIVLSYCISTAYLAFTSAPMNGKIMDANAAVMFVKGSGLEHTLELYALPYDAYNLREIFYDYVRRTTKGKVCLTSEDT
jgi:hypothetical protein